VAHHYEPLFRFALSLTRAEADARDLTQQAFYVWATKGYQLRDCSKAKAWLFTTLHRAFLASRRTHTRFRHYTLEDVPIHDLPACAPDFVNAVDSPQVLAALAKVDAVYQAALALFYLEDWSYREIAQILEVPVGTVKSRISRGIGQLRQLFGFSASERSIASVATQVNEKTPECNSAAGYTGWPERPSPSVPVSNHSPEPFPG
jgi:RNA polymerase sigma factor (sigma-70 family)